MNKSCWLQVLYGPLHCVQWKVSSCFPSCTWLGHKMYPVIWVERCWNAPRNAPQRVCRHLWSGPSDVDKDILLGFSQLREWLCRVVYFLAISIDLGSTGGLVTWHSIPSSPRDLCVVACGAISYFLNHFSSPPQHGDHEIFLSCWLWGLFTDKLPAISTIVSTKQTFPGKLLQNKNPSIHKRIWVNGWTADNTGHLPTRQRLVSCDLCCHGGAWHV